MEKSSCSLLKALKAGDLNKATIVINEINVSTKEAISAFIHICHVCTDPSKSTIGVKDLSRLITIILRQIINPSDEEKYDFTASSYHILKYLLNKNALDVVLETKEVWCPSFITINSPLKSLMTYTMQSMLVCYHLKNMLKSSNTKENAELFDLLIDMMDKLPLLIFFREGTFTYLKHFLQSNLNEKTFSKILDFLLQKCLMLTTPEKNFLDLMLHVFMSTKIPEDVLRNIILRYNTRTGSSSTTINPICDALNMVLKNGLSLESLKVIGGTMDLITNDMDKFTYIKILRVIFYDRFNRELYQHEDTFTWEFHNNLCDMLLPRSDIIVKVTNKCHNCQNCKLPHDFGSQIYVLMVGVKSFMHCVLNNEKVPPKVFKSTIDLYNEIILLISYLRRHMCKLWEKYFLQFLTYVFNTAVYANRKNNSSMNALTIFEIVVKEYLEFEPFLPDSDRLVEFSYIHTSLVSIAAIYASMGQIGLSMTAIAFNIFVCNKEPKTCQCVSQWIQTKTSNKRDLSIKRTTMLSLLANSELPYFQRELSDEEISYILMKEVKVYYAVWQSKIPLGECCTQIYNLCKPLLTVEALVIAWFDIPASLVQVPEVWHIVANILEQVNDLPTSTQEAINIAKVYFLQYHILVKSLQDEINKQISMEPPEPQDLESYKYGTNVPDNKWDCAIYKEMIIENVHNIKKPLLTSRKILENVFSSIDAEKKEILSKAKLLKFIMELAFAFLLHGDRIEYLKTLCFCKELAETINSADWIIKTTGRIIEEIDTKNIPPLLNEVEHNFKNAAPNVIAAFYINSSMAYLNYGDIEKATQNYLRAKDVYISASDEIIELELEFLEWNLLGMPCKNANDHGDFIAKTIYLQRKLDSFFVEQDQITSHMKLMLTHYMMRTKLHFDYWLRCPREGRASAKYMVKLCQSYILPLQFSETFIYLGNMDLLCEKLDDCQAKVSGLSELLDLPSVNMRYEDLENKIDTLTNSLQEMMLDVPKFSYTTSTSSPELRRDTVKYPYFVLHHIKCLCFYCTSLDYQKLILTYIVLKGNLWAFKNEFQNADYFYNFALSIYDNIIANKDEYVDKIDNLLGISTGWDLEKIFAECYAYILYNQGKIVMGSQRYNKIGEQLIKAVEKIKFINVHLYNEAYVQKTNHLYHLITKQHVPQKLLLSPIPTNKNSSPAKTPENQVTQIKVVKSISPKPVKTYVKPIKFNWSNEEGENKQVCEPIPTSNMGATIKMLKRDDKSSNVAMPKNPIPPKIKIYTSKENSKRNLHKAEKSVEPLYMGKVPLEVNAGTSKTKTVLSSKDDNQSTEQKDVRRSARNKK